MDLLEKLQAYALPATQVKNAAAAAQLRAQMQADALQPLTGSDAYDAPEDDKATSKKGSDAAVIPFTDELVEKAYVFLRSTVPIFVTTSVPFP